MRGSKEKNKEEKNELQARDLVRDPVAGAGGLSHPTPRYAASYRARIRYQPGLRLGAVLRSSRMHSALLPRMLSMRIDWYSNIRAILSVDGSYFQPFT